MRTPTPLDPQREILDQDLQIIRVTLATIMDDVRSISGGAANAMQEALENLDRAQAEFSHAPPPDRAPAAA